MRTSITLLLSLCAVCAQAQVHRCVDSAGKVAYSDTPCSAKAVRSDRMLDRSATQMREEPEGYRRQLLMESMERTAAQNRGDYGTGVPPPGPGGAVILDHNPNERIDAQSERNLQRRMAELDADRARRESQEEAAAERRRAGPGQMVNCDRAGCWGSGNGVRYNRAAGGNLTGTDGSFCVRAGNTFNCN